MALNKITILVFPQGSTKVKLLRVPRSLIIFISLLLVLCAAFVAWMIRDYRAIKPKMVRLAHLRKENEFQKRQFLHLLGQINQLTQQMMDLQDLNHRLRAMVNLEPGTDDIQSPGVGTPDPSPSRPDDPVHINYRGLVRHIHQSLDNLDRDIAADKRDKAELHRFFKSRKKLLASTPSIWPTKGWVSSRFGYRLSPFTGEKEFHNGIDISARMNSLIIAPADGIISSVTLEDLAGRAMYINHGYGLVTKYAHLNKIFVKQGQFVKRGESIALVGSTGRSTGPHLHYEVRVNGVPTNPMRYIFN